ncbi:unnamed protein product [Mesocestoides corti]|uniref:Uncharacterized protein n=1 Tax=Mesocestoides corti TaxID=53468 RepID=A0A0R3UDN5_MESCO|nr:unnamed protein product [Mesocestoides corti]
MHFDPEKQAANPRLFLLPVTNEKVHILACEYRLEACLLSTQQLSRLTGEVPFGCPSYLQCAHLLQEAIFSTPRQHMMPDLTEIRWFEFARQTWQSIATSPLFIDYYRLWMNNTL